MLTELVEFVEFLAEILKSNTDASHHNAMIHAATRDALQRVSDQLPNIVDDFQKKKLGDVGSEVAGAIVDQSVPVEADAPSSVS